MIVALREWVAWHPRFGRIRQSLHHATASMRHKSRRDCGPGQFCSKPPTTFKQGAVLACLLWELENLQKRRTVQRAADLVTTQGGESRRYPRFVPPTGAPATRHTRHAVMIRLPAGGSSIHRRSRYVDGSAQTHLSRNHFLCP